MTGPATGRATAAWVAAAACLLALGAAGCDQAAWIGYHVLKPIMPPEEVPAQFDLSNKSVLVLVDLADPDLGLEFPRLQEALAEAIGRDLAEQKAVGPVVPAASVARVRRTEPEFPTWSVARIGRHFNVDYVLHVVVQEFRVRETPTSTTLDGFAEATMRVVSPSEGRQVWPLQATARQTSAHTLPQIDPYEHPYEVERILTEGFGEKVARHFYTWRPEDLPLRPKVE